MITATAVGLLLVGVACFVLGVLDARARRWADAIVLVLAGVLLACCAFGVLP